MSLEGQVRSYSLSLIPTLPTLIKILVNGPLVSSNLPIMYEAQLCGSTPAESVHDTHLAPLESVSPQLLTANAIQIFQHTLSAVLAVSPFISKHWMICSSKCARSTDATSLSVW